MYTCICKEKPTRNLVACKIEPQGGIGKIHYDQLQSMSVRLKCNTVLWDTTYAPMVDPVALRQRELQHAEKAAHNRLNDQFLIRQNKLLAAKKFQWKSIKPTALDVA